MASLALVVAAAAVAGCAGEGDGTSTDSGAAVASPVLVAMHDPGCHWFQVGHSFTRRQSVTGPASFTNRDEAALNVWGPGGYRVVDVGQSTTLARGRYTVTMVGQARDDNVLHLSVH